MKRSQILLLNINVLIIATCGLVYELLDAHGDTMSLAGDFADSPAWAAHLDYLRGLQRVGREVLARVNTPAV